MASPLNMKRASAGARGYAVHPKVKIGGSLVLARPDALLNKEQYDAEILVFNWALKQVQGNMERIRAAYARLRPFEFDGDQNNRRNFVKAKNALQDAQFREAWLKQGIVYIMNLWDATKDKIKNIEALKAQAAKAALMAEKERIIAQIASLAAEANKASKDAAASLLPEDTSNANSGIAPPGEPTEPTDAGIVETVLDLPENASTAMIAAASVKETISAKKAADAVADTTEESFLSKYGMSIIVGVGAGVVLHNLMGRGNR